MLLAIVDINFIYIYDSRYVDTFIWIQGHEIRREKVSQLHDSYKCPSVDWMAADSRLSKGFSSEFLHRFLSCFSVNIFEQAVGPTPCSSSAL